MESEFAVEVSGRPLGKLGFQELLLELPWWEWEWEARKNVRAIAE